MPSKRDILVSKQMPVFILVECFGGALHRLTGLWCDRKVATIIMCDAMVLLKCAVLLGLQYETS